jgi:hypothetical protein
MTFDDLRTRLTQEVLSLHDVIEDSEAMPVSIVLGRSRGGKQKLVTTDQCQARPYQGDVW